MLKNIGRVERELLEEVDYYAKRAGQTRLAFIRFAIKDRLESYVKLYGPRT